MITEVSWRGNVTASNLHIAQAAVDQSPLIDPQLAEALRSPASQFAVALEATGTPPARFWRNLVPLAAQTSNRRQLIETAVTKTMGRGVRFATTVSHLIERLVAIDEAIAGALPNHAEDLEHRQRPLREQWEARGPGLLLQIGNLTDPALLPAHCEALVVYPALGGGGEAHLEYNSVRIEGVLANPVAALPEVVRLAWLIAQLQLDLPKYGEQVNAQRLPHVARFAMLPPVLAAAETVELVRFTPELVDAAISAWRLTTPAGVDAAAPVYEWWLTYQESRPPWPIALTALDQMLG